jgi:hypothetical protein
MITDLDFDLSAYGTAIVPPSVTTSQSASSGFYQLTFPVEDVETYNAPDDVSEDSGASSASQYCIGNLVQQNLSLQQKINRQADELAEARAQLRGYSGSSFESSNATGGSETEVLRLEAVKNADATHSGLLEVFNVPEFARILVCDLKPRLAKQLTPCLPAYLLLAAIRHNDHARDEAAISGLFGAINAMLKETVANSDDMDILSLWLVNTWRLLNLLRQYGADGEEMWTEKITEKQKGYRIQNFDLEPIRHQLQLRVDSFYNGLMKKTVEPVFGPKIVPAILQHEGFVLSSDANGQSGKPQQPSLADLIAFLSLVYSKLRQFGADDVLIGQTFKQLSRWLCALALNAWMFRKDLCSAAKALLIKHNVMEVENWLRSKNLGYCGEYLEPLVQACHMLQLPKTEFNLCGEMTSKLKPKQIIAILDHYSAEDNFQEEELTSEFKSNVRERLMQRSALAGISDGNENSELLIMRGTYLEPFDQSQFVYSEFGLETLALPPCLKLEMVARLL